MSVSHLWKLSALCILLQAAAGDALAEAPETCWRFMSLDASKPAYLIAPPDSNRKPELRFTASTESTLPPQDAKDGYESGTVVRLPSDGGLVVVEQGPLDVEQDKVTYRIPQGKTGAFPPTFIAEKGMEVKLLKSSRDGKLAKDAEAIVQLSGTPQKVGMVGRLVLRPAPRLTKDLTLLLPNLAWTWAGRSIDVEMIAPRFNQTELKGAAFQACIFASLGGSAQGLRIPPQRDR